MPVLCRHNTGKRLSYSIKLNTKVLNVLRPREVAGTIPAQYRHNAGRELQKNGKKRAKNNGFSDFFSKLRESGSTRPRSNLNRPTHVGHKATFPQLHVIRSRGPSYEIDLIVLILCTSTEVKALCRYCAGILCRHNTGKLFHTVLHILKF